MTNLAAWGDFYVIVGSAAGALIGLQFVVVSLLADRPRTVAAGSGFATPTIVHFGTALLLSALLRAPWPNSMAPRLAWGIVGLAGLAYALSILRHLRRQGAYRLVWQDWLFYFVLPLAAYVALLASALAANGGAARALFVVAAAVLVLLFVGIHNAWDTVAYHVFTVRSGPEPVAGRTAGLKTKSGPGNPEAT